jgi:hypothetical protein
MSARYQTVEQLAAQFGWSIRTLHERTRKRELPCRRLPGSRRILFIPEEIEAFVDSGGTMPLEVIEGPRGSLVVRPQLEARA